jgi:chromate transporter
MTGDPLRMLLGLLTTFAPLSLVAVGGANAVIPEIQHQVVAVHHWLPDRTFAELFAIAQAAPGPNVMVVSLIGWRIAGWPGLAVATVAICGPSCTLAYLVARFDARLRRWSWMASIRRGLAPIAVGLMLATGVIVARSADHNLAMVAVTAGVALTVLLTRVNPLWLLAAGALAGLAFAVL